jgi:methionyl-tRNA synthetase
MRLATEVNKYLDQTAPWIRVKTDKAAAGRAIYTALRAIDSLKILFAPFLPFTSERLHTSLGYDGSLFGEQSVETFKDSLGEHNALRYYPEKATGRWEPSLLKSGQKFNNPQPLFRKLDPSVVEEERARMGDKG